MISVVIYTLNDEQTIETCLTSLEIQADNFDAEVFVIDDGSTDGTPAIVKKRFPHFKLIREEIHCGWVECLRRHLEHFRGQLLAFLGAHCQAHPDWLSAIEEASAKGLEVFTGRGYHGEERLLERFEAFSVHADYISGKKGDVQFVWDDNFAISAELLAEALPDTNAFLSDGAGAYLLSKGLRDRGVTIHYQPSIKISHETHCFSEIMKMWYGEMATNAIAVRRVDRSLPGARLLCLGPIAFSVIAAGRLFQGIQTMARASRLLNTSTPELLFHIGVLTYLMPIYALGLYRQLISE